MAENKKSNQADAYMESMKAYQKTYDFLLYLYPILSQFPKFEKFALQSQIKTAVFEMLKSVIRFRKTGTKSHIYNADVELQFIKTLIRLSYDLEYPAMSKHRYEVLSKKMTELGCIIGGGDWSYGVHCGSRAVNCNNYPWNVNTNIGVRCVCDFTIL